MVARQCVCHEVIESYEAWVKIFEHMHLSWQGDRISSIAETGIALGNIKNIKFDAALFFAFSHSYWARHMKWIYFIDRVAKKFGHYYPLMLVRLMIMLDNLQEVKKAELKFLTIIRTLEKACPPTTTRMPYTERTQQIIRPNISLNNTIIL